MYALLAIAISLVCALIVLPAIGYLKLSLAAFLAAAALVPFPILLWSANAPNHTGIAYTSPALTTYGVALLLLALGLASSWQRNSWLFAYAATVAVYLVVGLLTVWGGVEAQWAGAIHWAFAVLALIVGYQLGAQMTQEVHSFMVKVIFALLLINAMFCVIQLAGYPVSVFSDQLETHIDNSRPIGTFSHPSTLGKFVIIVMIVVLPALYNKEAGARRVALWCLALAVPLVAVTLARANLVAVLIAVALWLLFDRRSRRVTAKRVLLIAGVALLSAPVIGATLERFAIDPGGGGRTTIYSAGLEQLKSNLWMGTGPNYYAEVVGQWDRMTALGYPLHNTFLYPVAELGIIGGIVFMSPILVVCSIATIDVLRGGAVGASPWSKAYVATFPGVMIIAMTGWGMLLGSTLRLWFFAIGVAASKITRSMVNSADSRERQRPSLSSERAQ